MFDNATFFPTPPEVIDMMVEKVAYYDDRWGWYISSKYDQILEPSAGKGDIVDRLVEKYKVRASNIRCIEQDATLVSTLHGKGYDVIDLDFLKYNGRYIFDLIIMNPPFNKGVDHLLKAWDVLSHGDIVCILNAQTILNPHTESRKRLMRLIKEHGDFELVGEVFADAERSTDVECAIVTLHKDKAHPDGWEFDTGSMDFESAVSDEDFAPSQLASSNIIDSMVQRYNVAREIIIQKHELDKRFKFYTEGIVGRTIPMSKEEADKQSAMERNRKSTLTSMEKDLQEKLDKLKEDFWNYIFDKTRVGQVTTSAFREEFERITTQTKRIGFTVDNIMMVLQTFYFNQGDIMKDCIIGAFDEATRYHAKNVDRDKAWVTNKAYKVNKKVIVPNGVSYDKQWGSFNLWYNSKSYDFFNDLDKALCYLSGQRFGDDEFLSIVAVLNDHIDNRRQRRVSYDTVIESTFFRIKMHKTGTVHLWFKDLDLLARFNQFASENKNWVGDGS